MTLVYSASTTPPIDLPPKIAEFCHTSNRLLVGRRRCRALLWLYFNSSSSGQSLVGWSTIRVPGLWEVSLQKEKYCTFYLNYLLPGPWISRISCGEGQMQEQACTVRTDEKAHSFFQSRLHHDVQEVTIAGISHRNKQGPGIDTPLHKKISSELAASNTEGRRKVLHATVKKTPSTRKVAQKRQHKI
jgi:hypothetical protein